MQIESHEPGAFTPVSDVMVLAAIERAQRHGPEDVWVAEVGHHLGFARAAATTRRLRPQLRSLQGAGSLTSTERHGREYWALTAAGRERVVTARAAGEVGELPESPQHRTWRRARAEAGEQIDGFRELASPALEDAERQLVAGGASSEQLFDLSERLRWDFWRLASATYCLGEWSEPDDARFDKDENPGPGPGRRSTSAWNCKQIDS